MPYIGNTIRAADDYRLIDDISSSFNGSTTSFALQVAGSAPVPFPKSPQQVLISVNGVIQEPDPTGASGFNLVGTNIVFSSAPTNGHAFFGIIYATADYLNSGGNFPTGSLGAPSITFVGDEDTGIYRKGSGSVAFVANSTEIANTDSNGITISSGDLILGDNRKAKFGASDDLQIFHDGNNSFINEVGTGGLFIRAQNTFNVQKAGTSDFMIKSTTDGAVELYHNGAVKLQTTANGIELPSSQSMFLGGKIDMTDSASTSTGRILLGTGDDLQIYHDGSNSYVDASTGTGDLFIKSADDIYLRSNGNDGGIDIHGQGAVDLYHNGTKRFETLSSGVKITGLNATGSSVLGDFRFKDQDDNLDVHYDAENNKIVFHDNNKATFGTADDLQIYHDGSNSYVNNTGTGVLILQGNGSSDVSVRATSGESGLVVKPNAAVEAYYDNTKRIETLSTGAKVTGRLGVDKSPTTLLNAELSVFAATGDDDASDWGADGIFQLDHSGTAAANNEVLMLGSVSGGVGQIASGFGFGRESTSNWGTYISFKTHSTSTSNIDELKERWKITSAGHFENNSDSVRIKLGASDDLQIYHDGSNSHIEEGGTGSLLIKGDTVNLGSVGGEYYFRGFENGKAVLRFDNSTKLETDSTRGVLFTHNHGGNEPLCQAAAKGAFHCGFIVDPDAGSQGHFRFARAGSLIAQIRNIADTTQLSMFFFNTNKEHDFFNNGNSEFDGDVSPKSNNVYDLGSTSKRWANVYTNDLNLSNEGSQNDIDSTWGDYTIQEGHEDLFLINNRTGKKFKFNLTEVS